jgi:hypothetical protein
MPRLRIAILGLSVLAAVFLVASVKYSVQQWQSLQVAQGNYSVAERKVRMMSEIEAQLPLFESYQEKLQAINAVVSKESLTEPNWTNKSVIVKDSVIARQDVAGFLKGIASKDDQWFRPKLFALKTISEHDDLFHWTSKSSSNLNLLLEGEYMIRRPL